MFEKTKAGTGHGCGNQIQSAEDIRFRSVNLLPLSTSFILCDFAVVAAGKSLTGTVTAQSLIATAMEGKGKGKKGNPPGQGKLRDPIVWVDLEMSGYARWTSVFHPLVCTASGKTFAHCFFCFSLDLSTDVILEIAVVVTDGQLNRIFEGPNLAIHQSDEVLNGMNEWCVKHHGE